MLKDKVGRAAAGVAVLMAGLVSGCGGGGGGGDDTAAATTSVNLAAFQRNRLHATGDWVLPGIVKYENGKSVMLQTTVSIRPGEQAAFPLTGASGNTSTTTLVLTGPDLPGDTTSQRLFFDADNRVFGSQDSDGTCSIVSHTAPLPTAAPIGATGPLSTVKSYAGCTPPGGNEPTDTVSQTWSVEIDNGVTLVCENSVSVVGLVGNECFEK